MRNLLALAAAATIMTSACTTTGTGTGVSHNGELSANFTWKESDAQAGHMTAQISDGRAYDGQYFQITHETNVTTLAPLWTGWGGRWGRWGGWGGYWGPDEDVVTHYSGRVLANLQGPDGYTRCRFRLARPSSGMGGGGTGQCQLPSGSMIHADFPPHS